MLIACHFVSFRHSRVKFYKADLLTFCQACRWRCEVFSGSWCQYCTAFDAMFVVRDNVHSCFHCHTVLRRTVILVQEHWWKYWWKVEKNVIKLIFFQNMHVTSYILTYQKPKKILLELISELTFEVRATLGCLQISQIAAISPGGGYRNTPELFS